MPTVDERVSRLELVLEEFIKSVGIEFNKLYNSQLKTEAELREFKDEMREENRKMNKRWGEISNKLGTTVEDIIYPALRPVIKQYLNCEPIDMVMNRRRVNSRMSMMPLWSVRTRYASLR